MGAQQAPEEGRASTGGGRRGGRGSKGDTAEEELRGEHQDCREAVEGGEEEGEDAQAQDGGWQRRLRGWREGQDGGRVGTAVGDNV